MAGDKHPPASAFRPPRGFPVVVPPAPAPSTSAQRLSHALPLPAHLALSTASTTLQVAVAAVTHLVDGPVRPGWSLATTLAHAALKATLVNHPPQGRHSLSIVRAATQFAIPAAMLGASRTGASVDIAMPAGLARTVADAVCPGAVLRNAVSCSAAAARSIPGEWIRHNSLGPASDSEPVVLYLHGGAHIFMSPGTHRAITARVSQSARASVFVPDYRLAPENPFPSAIEDALACYLALTGLDFPGSTFAAALRQPVKTASAVPTLPISPSRIIVAGDSSGACLSLQLVQLLKALRIPRPAGMVMLSPFLDHEISSPSFHKNWSSDFLSLDIDGVEWALDVYANGLPRSHPSVSPIFGDLWDLPPMLIQAGDAEVVTDDAVGLFKRAAALGNHVELQLFTNMFHVFHTFPMVGEAAEAFRRIGHFVQTLQSQTPQGSVSVAVDAVGSDSESQSSKSPQACALPLSVASADVDPSETLSGTTPPPSARSFVRVQLLRGTIVESRELVHDM
ncbi:hypothetical protein HK105_203094 [Polyrhizophydium stewartii]|uniref:Alpha/beta hydrolase fold-3 domain-containing protein n=1 Tax=Polyrhizophydium stewartii TaxID=2732419 RepID=A0ABR4ND14_9FUNG